MHIPFCREVVLLMEPFGAFSLLQSTLAAVECRQMFVLTEYIFGESHTILLELILCFVM